MKTSEQFRSQNNVIASYKILRGAVGKAYADYPAEGFDLTTPPRDVIDLDGDGQAGFEVSRKDDYVGSIGLFTEPCIASPSLEQAERVARDLKADVLTQDDFRQGLFIETFGVETFPLGGSSTTIHENLRPASQLVAAFEPWEPDARFAVDFCSGEFLIYKPLRAVREPHEDALGIESRIEEFVRAHYNDTRPGEFADVLAYL